ncbi:MAG TPA: hypothetical protein VIV66_12745 [Pyrinomonadaceae bacterium]
MVDIKSSVIKSYEGKSLKEILDSPVECIQGLSVGDAQKLKEAFNIKTVRDLATNKFVLLAQEIKREVEGTRAATGTK